MEDIKILEKIIESYKECFVENYEMCVDVGMRLRDLQAIENLIARNKELETLLKGNLYQMFLYYKELAGRYQANSISKDKVKDEISYLMQKYNLEEDYINYETVIKILQELLKEN